MRRIKFTLDANAVAVGQLGKRERGENGDIVDGGLNKRAKHNAWIINC